MWRNLPVEAEVSQWPFLRCLPVSEVLFCLNKRAHIPHCDAVWEEVLAATLRFTLKTLWAEKWECVPRGLQLDRVQAYQKPCCRGVSKWKCQNSKSDNGVVNDKDFRLSVLTMSFVSPEFWYMRQLGNILGNLGGIATMWWGAAGGDINTSQSWDHNLSNKINRVLLGSNDSTLGIWDKEEGKVLCLEMLEKVRS